MKHVGRLLWLAPFAVHVAYLLASSAQLPPGLGAAPGEAGTSPRLFLVEWLTVVGLANAALLLVHVRLPRFGDRMLSVPRKELWLGSAAPRAELVERLRGFVETALLLLNVFFLAVYQSIYQANAPRPALALPVEALAVGFMGVPILLILLAFAALLRRLRRGPAATP